VQFVPDVFDNHLAMIEHLVVPESDYAPPLFGEYTVAMSISLPILV
jgi:hypothetical protein